MEIAEFLLARFDEDEAVARAATPGPWRWGEDLADGLESESALRGSIYADDARGTYLGRYVRLPSEPPPAGARLDYEFPVDVISAHGEHTTGYVDIEPADAEHIACHDPARALAECEAKRRIVEMVVAADDPVGTFDPDYWVGLGVAEAALQLLALPYAGHPDYREAWRP